jgi:hypothetical protein
VLLIWQPNLMAWTYILCRGRSNRNAAGKVFVAEKAVAKPSNDRRLWFQRTQGQGELKFDCDGFYVIGLSDKFGKFERQSKRQHLDLPIFVVRCMA